MWHLITSVFAKTFTYATLSSTSTTDCTLDFRRRVVPNFVPRIIPATKSDGLLVVWQDSESIYLQRYALSCDPIGGHVEVNRSEDFFRDPGASGLADVAWLGSDDAVVAWTLGGEVWVRVVRTNGLDSPPTRVNGPQRYNRAEVRVISNSDGSGFVVAWSSWAQDRGGWGVFARRLDMNAQPVKGEPEERQVNEHLSSIEWQLQLMWCGNSLWALYSNISGGSCDPGVQCTVGPFVRRIAVSEDTNWSKHMRDEINLMGHGPLAAALTCSSAADNATVFWLDNGGETVEGRRIGPDTPPKLRVSAPTPAISHVISNSTVARHHHLLHDDVHSMGQRQVAMPAVARRLPSFRGQPAGLPLEQARASSSRSLSGESEESDLVGAGQVAMIAHQTLVVLLTNSGQGTLDAQLLNFGDSRAVFPKHQIASGVQFARASWDHEGDSLAIIICWASGSVLEEEDPSGFYCARRRAAWLVDSGSLEFGGKLALIVVLSVVLFFCCMRHCSRVGALNRLPMARRRALTDAGRNARRTASQARIRELREQLAQIPETPPSVQMQGLATEASNDAQAEQGTSAAGNAVQPSDAQPTEADSATTALRDVGTRDESTSAISLASRSNSFRWTTSRTESLNACSICQNEVAMWVALRPCGHTACRQCVLRIVEMNQRCHICRSTIEGVLPVYI